MCFDEILEKMLLENFKVNSKGSNPDVDRENIYFCGFAEINQDEKNYEFMNQYATIPTHK